ncbi:MAG: phage minor head protein [Deltaproteobacteria bacterium]|nr:phage minor head protein [Deltaproteobacteria bacterium]
MKVKPEPLTNKEAVAFWGDKILLSPGDYASLTDEAKLHAFSVSGIARGSELTTVYESLQKALNDGITYDQFKKSAAEVFEKRGWTGKRAWRVDNIFRTNVQQAYSIGRYKQMKAVTDLRPYWMYDAVNDSGTRPTHRALNGKVYPADHPFWDTWYPLNGFRCRCGATTLSERQLKKKGLKVETKDLTGMLIEPELPNGTKLPARLLMPDPGFSYHPGKQVYGGLVENEKPGVWRSLPGIKKPAHYRRRDLKNVRPADIDDISATQLLKKGEGDAFYKSEFIKRYGEEKVLTDANRDPVILSLRSFLVDKTPGAKEVWKFGKSGHGESIPLLAEMIEKPYEIWLTPQVNEDGRIRLSKRYVSLWKSPDKKKVGGLMVFEVDGGVFRGVTAFIPLKKGEPDLKYAERVREGLLLWGKGR